MTLTDPRRDPLTPQFADWLAGLGVKPDDSSVVYFIGIDAARFKRPVEPGDQLKMEVQIVRTARGIWKYKASASVDGQLAVEAELMCTMRNAADASQPAVQ